MDCKSDANPTTQEAAPSTMASFSKSSVRDVNDMRRMGKVQELKRYFGPWAIVGFASILGCAWEYALITVIFSLPNGGPAGAVWMFLLCCFGLFLSTLSLAEMASMSVKSSSDQEMVARSPDYIHRAPSAGGQYHWISELAPRSTQKFLSYIVGWLCVLGWQVGLSSVSYAAALQIESFAILLDPTTTFETWHTSLFTIAVAIIAVIFNTVFVKRLPAAESFMFVLHVAAFIAFVSVLLYFGPPASRHEVFDVYENANGWPNTPSAVLVGIIAPITTLTSADSICHLAEELHDASRWLPRCMVAAAVMNFTASFLMLLVVLFRAGNIEDALTSPTGQPYIEILLNATGSIPATAVMVFWIVLSLIFCAINMVTTSSRQLWAFSRDQGMPFSASLSKVSVRWNVPHVAITATLVFNGTISLIIIGSSSAFNIIVSLGASAILSSYIISISCVTYRRLSGNALLPSSFSLGRAGLTINVLALVFLWIAFIMVFFPAAPRPTVASMNWSVLIFGSVVTFALIFYCVKKRHVYQGPVEKVCGGEYRDSDDHRSNDHRGINQEGHKPALNVL